MQLQKSNVNFWPRLPNRHGFQNEKKIISQEQNTAQQANAVNLPAKVRSSKPARFEFTPKVIIRVKFDEPLLDNSATQFKVSN